MQRQIFIVKASVVDANGTFSWLDGYPKTFDSKNYDNDVDKTQRRADGDASDAWSKMCKADTRQLQTLTLETADGFQLYKKSMGRLADLPNQAPAE